MKFDMNSEARDLRGGAKSIRDALTQAAAANNTNEVRLAALTRAAQVTAQSLETIAAALERIKL